jgi:hypothetical protein
MNLDVGPILDGWDYHLGKISARKITGVDGKAKVQLRLDMGLLQMECRGRPDGQKPHGRRSLVDHYKHLARIREQESGAGAFTLSPEDCVALQLESIQYYHRRVAFFELKEYEGARRDAEHNLQILDMVKEYASDSRYAQAFEQHRPSILAHRTRAEGSICLRDGQVDEALQRIEDGIRQIEESLKTTDEAGLMDGASEIESLKQWVEEIMVDRPLTPEERLQAELDKAVRNEDFERAAQLRDTICGLKPGETGGSTP